jgi:hypothetical protein
MQTFFSKYFLFIIKLVSDHFDTEIDIQRWSQYVAFVFIGILILSSIRGLLIQLSRVLLFVISITKTF